MFPWPVVVVLLFFKFSAEKQKKQPADTKEATGSENSKKKAVGFTPPHAHVVL